MTEKEKMLAGILFNPMDFEILKERENAKKLCQMFNNMPYEKYEERKSILKELFNTSNECYAEPNFFCDFGYNIEVGNGFYANHNCIILDEAKVKIGNNVLLGPNVHVYTVTHPVNPTERASGKELAYPVEIGDNVWIGGGSIICPGVKIGSNTTIAAGSVVINDIPENVLAAGNPCSVIKNV
jgi:maltose O-acetyltransferase